jgi:3'(2'), 5'-bisphosphate nucleotidase
LFSITDERTRVALEIVAAAAEMARDIQASMAVLKTAKPDLSPVTVADYAVQALAAHKLGEHFPGEGLVAEETSEQLAGSADVLDAVTGFVGRRIAGARPADVIEWIDRGAGAGTKGRAYWVLDPIDGTKGYLRGGQYAVALALVEEGQVRLGVLGCPNLGGDCRPAMGHGRLVVAVRGQGAWQGAADGAGPFEPIRVSLQSDPRQARLLRSHEAGHTNVGQIEALARGLHIAAEPVLMDSQAKCAVLAAGHAEIMLRLLSPDRPDYREKIWDQAAGSIIIEEAGGRVTDIGGKALDFRTGRRLENNWGVVATNGLLHETVLAALAEIV